MKNNTVIVLIFMIGMLSSCIGIIRLSDEANPTIKSTLINTEKPNLVTEITAPDPSVTSTHQVTSPSIQPSTILSITSTPTIPHEANIKIDCVEISDNRLIELGLEGIIILDSRNTMDTYLLNLSSGDQRLISKPNENRVDFIVSPDSKKLAFIRVVFDQPGGVIVDGWLEIIASENQETLSIPFEEGWLSLLRWLDNEHILINIRDDSTKKLLVLNPYTGEKHELQTVFPDIYDNYPEPNWENNGMTMYDPMMRWVIFPKSGEPEGLLSIPTFEYVLWDTQNHKPVAFIPTYDVHHYDPKWSPDGSGFLVPVLLEDANKIFNIELFSVDLNGKITQMTNLTSYYEFVDIRRYRWSPDGHHIAFWLDTEQPPGRDERLAILDMESREVTNTCLQGDFGGSLAGNPEPPAPLWSPDGKHLLVENRYKEGASRVYIVDLERETAVQIAENMKPGGWIISDP